MKRTLSLLLLLVCCISYTFFYAYFLSRGVSDNIVRFHIIANSNTVFDQNIKLDLRDHILANVENSNSYPDEQFLKNISDISDKWLKENNIPYSAKVSFERTFIPKKDYKKISLPKGMYNAVKLVLGNGEGENWWCIAYPTLCFTDQNVQYLEPSQEKLLKENMPKECFDMISGEKKYSFFIAECFGALIEKLAG